jgi:excinuclease ABC subunit A
LLYNEIQPFRVPNRDITFMPPGKIAQKTSARPTVVDGVITIKGARVHNLKNIDVDLPRNKLIVMSGVSGSGKSSLAFDTIYAEGQRRYVESLSSYARQFLERMEKPDVDLIQGIGPAMAIEQKTNTRNPRSTVATTTEIYDYLRLLFARIGKTTCSKCGSPVVRDSVRSVLQFLEEKASTTDPAQGIRFHVTFPLPIHPKETLSEALMNIRKEGFFRVVVDGLIIDLNEASVPARIRPEQVSVLVDRLVFRSGEETARFADSIEIAFASGGGRLSVVFVDDSSTKRFNRNLECATCGLAYEEPDARLFSFNSPFGACPECQGFGRAVGIDMDLVVPDKRKSLKDGAVQPWSTPKFSGVLRDLLSVAKRAGIRTNIPYGKLSEPELEVLRNGFEDFEGISGFFRRVERKSYKIYYRVLLSRYRGYTTCSLCKGTRLRQEALNIRIDGKRISDLVCLTVQHALQFFLSLKLTPYEEEVARRILDEVKKRLTYLNEVGIGYLSLDRLSSTLSGGESQRINLATSLGSSLVGAVYVLDEPSIGLHPRDGEKLIRILNALRDVGNTVIVVEHDAEMIRAADLVVDLGPGAGEHGGEVMFVGSPSALMESKLSLTGGYLSGRNSIPIPRSRRKGNNHSIRIAGASLHNLKDLSVTFPLDMLVCVTGVSGSGKSTLMYDILYEGLKRKKGGGNGIQASSPSFEGDEHVDAVECVDQSPIGRTPRSNPVTYIQIFDQIRALFAATQAARVHGFKPGHFSFNVPGGRCEACEGDGVVKVEMQFMADLYITCDVCKGTRFQKEVLEVRWNGRSINDVLTMTVSTAIAFFGSKREGSRISHRLKVLEDVGLGYVRLGQPATSLSGGEAQRVKLAAHLAASASDCRTLFLFDEPTTGLHVDDIAKLIRCFNALIEAGNSVVVIEHNLEVIKSADHVIDLGPEAGEMGGDIVAVGTPEQVAKNPASHTGRFLHRCLF